MLRKSVLTVALAVAGLSLGSLGAGCGPGEENGGEGGGTDAGKSELACGDGHAEVTAEQVYTDVFADNCASCHTTGQMGTTFFADDAAMLRAAVGADSAYPGTVKVVEANKPENSTLFIKISGGSPRYSAPDGTRVGGPMPQGGALSDEQRKLFKDWICTGAK